MKDVVVRLIARETKLKSDEVSNLLEVPANDDFGDYAFPCFVLARKLKKNPVEIAEELAGKFKGKSFAKISLIEARQGYLNFFLDRKVVAWSVLESSKEDSKKSNGKKRMIEFSQPNTHKAFHVGHIRGTSIGESLARIFEHEGDSVIRANYSGDTGMHIAKWIWCYSKYHKNEKLKDDEAWIAGIYVDAVKRLGKNEKLQEEVNEINRKLDSKEDKELNKLWERTRKLSIDSWKKIYDELNTGFDKHYFESEVEQAGKKIVESLVKKKIAKVSDGAVIVDLEKYGLGIWVLLRSDGTVLYSAKDLVLAEKKSKDYKLDESLYVVADAQSLHLKQLIKTLELMKFKDVEKLKHVDYGLVRLPTGKMSSRTGDNILYSDFMKEITDYAKVEIKKRFKLGKAEMEKRALAISIAAIKYSMLKQDINKTIIFDKKEALRFEGDTGPYLLYSYARASSILRKVKGRKAVKIVDLNEHEVKLLKKLGVFLEVVERAYQGLAVNLIANYCYELAQIFNEFYHNCPVLGSVDEGFRFGLVEAFRKVMKSGLGLLGIGVLEEM